MKTLCCAGVALWLGFAVATPAQTRLGASIYVQDTAPTSLAVVSIGHFWFDTTSNALNVLTSLAPVTWTPVSGGGGGGTTIPAGLISLISAGTCPAGWAEVAALNGKMLRGTVAANGDVGTTGGSDSVTPTFTGNSVASSSDSAGTPAGTVAWPAGVPTFTGAQMATHLHAFGTIAVAAHTVVATKQGTAAGNVVTTATHTVSGSTAAITAGTPTGTNAWPAGVPTFSGSALGTHAHTTTATGTISAVDTRSAYTNVIFCSKT